MDQEDGGIRSSRTLSDTVAFAQVFLSVLALLFYPVGLLTLWLQIRLSYTLDGLTAWYATSLLPVNVVAGKILDIVLPWAGIAFANAAAIAAMVRGTLPKWFGIPLILLALIFPPLVSFVLPGGINGLEIWLFIFYLVFCTLGGILSGRSEQTDEGQGQSNYFGSLVPAAVFAVLGAVALTGLQGVYLPSVEFETAHQENQRFGTLLSHSNGYWYVIECKNAETTTPYSQDLYEIHMPGVPEQQPSDDEKLIIPESSDDLLGLTNAYTQDVEADKQRGPITLALAVSAIPDDKAGVIRFLEPPSTTSTFARYATTQDVTLCLY